MHSLIGIHPEDFPVIVNQHVIVPGAVEPEWLRRSAEYARELPLLLAERRAQRERDADERQSIVARLRLALSRA